MADAETMRAYFMGPSSIGPIMQLPGLFCQYWSKIKKQSLGALGR